MSRIGKMPVSIPAKIKVELRGSEISVTGPKGAMTKALHPDMKVSIENQEVLVSRPSDDKAHRALHGLTRALIHNMVLGVSEGFSRTLLMVGIGFRAEVKERSLILYLGYSHPIIFIPPEGVYVSVVPKENKIVVDGIDKELVGQTAAKIRSLRKPDPYKGKGIRYLDEQVRIKAGKTAG
ncbi:MAG: 50S ribosomal protein L6 [candidate division Zixibacteria bacterium]|nr:50S ribosomal protein L6 [candidate division Zixibacteria bacterium]MDD5425446.1 50S ribosomal protein L6 [candidate division Zixibacteria bacterium]